MGTLYITEQGATLAKHSRRLVVYKNEEKINEFSTINIDRVMLFGNIQVTAQAVTFLLDSNIDLCYLSSRGKYRGRLVPPESKNILLRIAQYERYLNDEFQIQMSKTIVSAKIKNALGLIARYKSNYPELDFSKEIESLKRSLENVQTQTEVSSLLGVEGSSTAVYFRTFGQMFRKVGLEFTQRSRRPPKDPINALLSFGYTLVTNEILSFIFAVGLDPYIGFMHTLEYGRPSLALDMTEEFRHPLIDRFTLYLINNGIINPLDFQNRGDEGVFLSQDALKRYLRQYEKRLEEIFHDDATNENVNYRGLFRRQIYRLAKTIQTGDIYEPYTEER